MIGIYYIRNELTGHRYIGQSINSVVRLQNHFSALRSGRHPNEHLQRAFTKYGRDVFVAGMLEVLGAPDLLNARESSWINYYRSSESAFGYNLNGGGDAATEVSDLTRAKLSAVLSGKPKSEQHRASMRAAAARRPRIVLSPDRQATMLAASLAKIKGVPLSAEHRRKISESEKGKFVSAETRARMAVATKGRKHSAETKLKMAETRKGHAVSLETRAKLSKSNVGQRRSEATRARMSAASKGKPKGPQSAEHRARTSEARKRYWAELKKKQSLK